MVPVEHTKCMSSAGYCTLDQTTTVVSIGPPSYLWTALVSVSLPGSFFSHNIIWKLEFVSLRSLDIGMHAHECA